MCVESYKYWIQVVKSDKFAPSPTSSLLWYGKITNKRSDGKSLLLQFVIQNPTSQLKINKMSMNMDCESWKKEEEFGFNRKTFCHVKSKSLQSQLERSNNRISWEYEARNHWRRVIEDKFKWVIVAYKWLFVEDLDSVA